jgi:hypothetical protein
MSERTNTPPGKTDESKPPSDPEAFDGLLAPLVPGLGKKIDVAQDRRPTYLNVYRGNWNKRVYRGKVPLRATPQHIREQCDHGEGGTYWLVAHDQFDNIWPCEAGQLELEAEPIMYAEFKQREMERVQSINRGEAIGQARVRDENRELADRLDRFERVLAGLERNASGAGGGLQAPGATDPNLVAILARMETTISNMNRGQSTTEVLDLITKVEALRGHGGGAPAPTDTIAGAKGLLDLLKSFNEFTGGTAAAAKPDAADQLAKKLSAVTTFVDKLAPKAGTLVSIIADELRNGGIQNPPTQTNGGALPPASQGGTSTVDWTPFKNDLETKLANPAITPDQIADDFMKALNEQKLPRYVKALLVMVDEANLESQLEAIERPGWGREPLRTKFLRTVEILRNRK